MVTCHGYALSRREETTVSDTQEKTAAQRAWTQFAYPHPQVVTVLARAEEVAADVAELTKRIAAIAGAQVVNQSDVAALAKRVGDLTHKTSEQDDRNLELISDLYARYRALESQPRYVPVGVASGSERPENYLKVLGELRCDVDFLQRRMSDGVNRGATMFEEEIQERDGSVCRCGHVKAKHYRDGDCVILTCDCQQYVRAQPEPPTPALDPVLLAIQTLYELLPETDELKIELRLDWWSRTGNDPERYRTGEAIRAIELYGREGA